MIMIQFCYKILCYSSEPLQQSQNYTQMRDKYFIIQTQYKDKIMVKKQLDVEYGPRIHLKGSTVVPGKWTKAQNRKYLAFLLENRQKIEDRYQIRQHRIYRAMSHKIPGRTSDQCRGHHRRMIEVYKSIDRIIKRLRNIFEIQSSSELKYQSEQGIRILNNHKTGQTNIIRLQLNIDELYSW